MTKELAVDAIKADCSLPLESSSAHEVAACSNYPIEEYKEYLLSLEQAVMSIPTQDHVLVAGHRFKCSPGLTRWPTHLTISEW